ncbi:MAG: 30S ribosomal protein S3 [Chloroflexi bacterium]|nr:30S ribosomal protein S3 [Chloroflexota bacterium]
MGHKVHPFGFRIGVLRDWESKWYSEKSYREFLQEDLKIRRAIRSWYEEAGISKIDINRRANEVTITIHTARPGIIIGRGGQRVNEMKSRLEKLVGKKVQLNIQEIPQPELDAYLVARNVADQIERRIAYRRAMRQAIFRTLQAGAKGVRVHAAGRLGGQEIARREASHQGRVPLHTLRADIDYGFTEAHTTLGRIGIKVWIYKGDVFPKREEVELEERPAEAIAPVAEAPAAEATAQPEAAPAATIEEKPSPAVEGEPNVTT